MKYFPVELKQPDGNIINVFLTGDEYYNWVHDKDNYTIIQNQSTGFYVYADLSDGKLISTSFIVGKTDPKSTSLRPGLNITPEEMLSYRKHFIEMSPPDMGQTPTTGTINNLVVFIRFSDESEFTDLKTTYDNMFNNSTSGYNSMYNYFREVSYNSLSITSTYYPVTAGTTVISYQDSHTRAYFTPYSVSNPTGYNGDSQRTTREHTLLVNAVNYISSQVPTSLNLDGDNDGRVDNVCFIIYGSPTAWATLLWPHRWSLYTQTVNINGKRVYDYNFQLQTHMQSSGVGVLCHEMFHSLGSPDLYHYSYDGFSTVGSWDLMENNQNPPQHMGAYMKYRYGHWISSIPVITSGTFSLNPITSSTGNCYRINSPNSTTEYFVVEYRRKTGTFEGSIPGTGMLVYRINSTYDGEGNASGPPDEVYIYRPGGSPTTNGTISSANFSSTVGRTAINDVTDPYSFLYNGSPGGLNISGIGSGGTSISFTLSGIAPPPAVTNLTVINPMSNRLTLRWTVPAGAAGYDIRYSTSPINDSAAYYNAAQLAFTGPYDTAGALQTFIVNNLNPAVTYFFRLKAMNAVSVYSAMSNQASATTLAAPQASVNPLSINELLPPSVITSDTIKIGNITSYTSTLDFYVDITNSTFPRGLITASIQGSDARQDRNPGSKDAPDESPGYSIKGSGGPDYYGYKWKDSNEPNGPSYSWADISSTGTQITNWTSTGSFDARDEGYSGPFVLGFNFNFYGNIKTQLYVSSNGLVTFSPVPSDIYTNTSIPSASVPNEYIAPFWDDLDGSSQGAVYYKQYSDHFVIQFSNWQKYGASSSLTFQVVLYKDGNVCFYYNYMTGTLTSATAGMEDAAGTGGLGIVYNAAYITNALAVKISKNPEWLGISSTSGTIYNGNSVSIILTFTTDSYPEGIYSLDLVINSNDPSSPSITVPVVMELRTPSVLNQFRVLFEGSFNGISTLPDTITVELRNASGPFALADQTKIILDSTGTGNGIFYHASNGTPYYLVVKHRSGLETWSAAGESFSSNSLSYDFTSAQNKAYGNNLVLAGGKWCIYSGDVNQDGLINITDVELIYIQNVLGSSGYSAFDLNGDQLVEIIDLNIAFINKVLGIQRIRP